MTDRLRGFVVVLEKDIRDDDAEGIISAIKHLRLVQDVRPVVNSPSDTITQSRVRIEILQQLIAMLTEPLTREKAGNA